MNITHLSVVSVPVADLQVAKTFYTQTLGFMVIRDMVANEQRWVELAPAGSPVSLILVTWFPQMPPGALQGLVLDTDNILEAHKTLLKRGVQVSPIETDQWGSFIHFTDPDGNGLILRQESSAR